MARVPGNQIGATSLRLPPTIRYVLIRSAKLSTSGPPMSGTRPAGSPGAGSVSRSAPRQHRAVNDEPGRNRDHRRRDHRLGAFEQRPCRRQLSRSLDKRCLATNRLRAGRARTPCSWRPAPRASAASSPRASRACGTRAKADRSSPRTIRPTHADRRCQHEQRRDALPRRDRTAAGWIALRYGGFYGAANDGLVGPVRKRQFPIVGDDVLGAKPPRHVPVWLARMIAADDRRGADVRVQSIEGNSRMSSTRACLAASMAQRLTARM